ncbi:MAG: biotin--[acetyl-CoA-carboxylase] ligase [Ruminococcaceae bacterium]|nr:biotin--[acetyl-CoA-carboxylase] ligase [Oscillospiraceae bacterium]
MKECADEKIIRKYLSDYAEDIKIETVNTIDSTNDEMKRRAEKGEKEISLLIAEEQTKGKGTKGRSFFSPDGTGIYMSFLLRPIYTPQQCTLLTTMTAVSTAKAIEKVAGRQSQIKWVNDIYLNRKKTGGILTQAHLSKNGKEIEWAVVGIGINLSEPAGGFPEELREIATALGKKDGHIKNRLISEIINEFIFYYRNLTKKEFIEEYSKRLLGLNEEIIVKEGEEEYKGEMIGIDDMCRLKIRLPDGREKTLNSAL